jgi:hypothetical protein
VLAILKGIFVAPHYLFPLYRTLICLGNGPICSLYQPKELISKIQFAVCQTFVKLSWQTVSSELKTKQTIVSKKTVG